MAASHFLGSTARSDDRNIIYDTYQLERRCMCDQEQGVSQHFHPNSVALIRTDVILTRESSVTRHVRG